MGRMVFVKVKIKLNTMEDYALFCAICGEYKEDIDYLNRLVRNHIGFRRWDE